MRLETRKLLDRAFSGTGVIAIGVMALALVVILAPIIGKGTGAFVFRSTIEHRKVMFDQWGRGTPERVEADKAPAAAARQPVYDMLAAFAAELDEMPRADRRPYKTPVRDLEKALEELFGPAPGQRTPVLIRQQYGATRWDRTKIKLGELLFTEQWDYSNPDALGVLVKTPRSEQFKETSLEPLFDYVDENIEAIMRPRLTFYWQFLFDTSKDSHIFGGIGPEVLGTLYLTLGAMIFAIPMGVIAAIYLCEYAREGRVVSFLRICISTLAGVPSIVFGLFGLAFFLNTIHISDSKSVLAGSLTLSLLILPTVIRASEEAILAVPKAYKEAALSLGAGRWHTVLTVILPAALPGILTGVVISMGRAAGETAPIIFTAAVSVGRPLLPMQTLSQPTPALPWNIYNLCTEHEAVDEIRHVQYGMVFTLVALVLLLNVFAIVMRARISKKLRG
ncbi:MAG: phosphate ABC transporter permease PstA [Kiritimatiellales bacterium]|nr:phosphate ABC transporter permease PstA [Kiritimatiellota bacterium]MBL7012501.1 phosphate ABC transporter permease PstA [Kiritimatiellales bacterium]